MNPPRRTISFAALAAALTVVFVAALGLLAGGASAQATEVERVDIVLDFAGLQPGVPRAAHYPVDVPVDAQIAEARFVRLTGIAEHIDWTIELCRAQSCREVTETSAGTAVAPGSYDLQVSAVLTADISGTGEALGRVRLVAADTLPSTGTTVTRVVSLLAGGAVVLGSVTLVAARRREASP